MTADEKQKVRLISTGDDDAEKQMRRMSRKSFLQGAAGVAFIFGARHWIDTRRMRQELPWPLRRALQVNEEFWHDFASTGHLAPTFHPSAIGHARTNGDVGLDNPQDASTWRLKVTGLDTSNGGPDSMAFKLEDIKSLPAFTIITQFKCIEGWSYVMSWRGARLVDFMAKYSPAIKTDDNGDPLPPVRGVPAYPDFVAMSTPDKQYYVGLDMQSARHPQTLLCYEMNGRPLTQEHGAPLRLIIPVKYGVKNIKRIGHIHYTNRRPADYWAEQGYDWYAEL